MNKLVLASTSPRRRELLQSAEGEFEVISSPAEELHDDTIDFRTLCEINAELKARAVAERRPESWVLGADTLVSIDGSLLGKPANAVRARESATLLDMHRSRRQPQIEGRLPVS